MFSRRFFAGGSRQPLVARLTFVLHERDDGVTQPGWPTWHGWWQIAGGVAAAGTSVFPISRSTDHLDVFTIGTDHGIYTAAWQPGFTGWHGWWRIAGGFAEGG